MLIKIIIPVISLEIFHCIINIFISFINIKIIIFIFSKIYIKIII